MHGQGDVEQGERGHDRGVRPDRLEAVIPGLEPGLAGDVDGFPQTAALEKTAGAALRETGQRYAVVLATIAANGFIASALDAL